MSFLHVVSCKIKPNQNRHNSLSVIHIEKEIPNTINNEDITICDRFSLQNRIITLMLHVSIMFI